MIRSVTCFPLTIVFVFFVVGLTYGQQCAISTSKTDITANGANNGIASVTISGGQLPTYSCSSYGIPLGCLYGCNSTNSQIMVTANNSSQAVTVNSGQQACIQGSGYSGIIQVNTGGTVLLCGTNAVPSKVIFNGGSLYIGSSATLNTITVPNVTGSTLYNYGVLTFPSGFTNSINVNNLGTLNVTNGNVIISPSTGQLTNNYIMNILSGSLTNQHITSNTGTLNISGTLVNDYNSTFTNSCTINVGSNFTNRNAFNNSGAISVTGNTLNDYSSTLTNVQRSVFSTKGLTNNGILAGTPTAQATNCSVLKASSNIVMASGSSVTGSISICQSGGTLTNTGNVPISFFNCACNLALGSCTTVWTNSSNVQVGTGASLTNLAEDIYTVTVNCSNCPNGPIKSNVIIKQPLPASSYAELKTELDGNYLNVLNNQLYFKYIEKYSDAGSLNYQIYDYQRNGMINDFNSVNLSSPKTGANFYTLNLTTIAAFSAKDYSKEENKYYTLEILNGKGEKFQLRFKYLPL